MFHSPSKRVLYAAYRIQVTHLSAAGGEIVISGTAFYIKRENQMFLVTNRHNLDAVMKNGKYAGYRPRYLTLSGYFNDEHLTAEVAEQEISIAFCDNTEEDVAAINVTNTGFMVDKQKEMTATYFDFSSLADDDNLSTLDICDLVVLPGYPAYFDRNGDRPIARMGTIASDPSSDYRDADMLPARRIAYEAFSSAGSSGSPVFALAKGWKAGIGLSGGYFRDSRLIGINAGHLPARDETRGHSGISYCFKSTCIVEVINRLFNKGS